MLVLTCQNIELTNWGSATGLMESWDSSTPQNIPVPILSDSDSKYMANVTDLEIRMVKRWGNKKRNVLNLTVENMLSWMSSILYQFSWGYRELPTLLAIRFSKERNMKSFLCNSNVKLKFYLDKIVLDPVLTIWTI